MAHKTMVDGTVYDIGGGKTMVDSTVYSIQKGKTMVDGTVREIAFSSKIAVEITGTGDRTNMYVEIDGSKFYSATSKVYETIDKVYLYVKSTQTSGYNRITINGELATSATGKNAATYTYQVPNGVRKIRIEFGNMDGLIRKITLTTE